MSQTGDEPLGYVPPAPSSPHVAHLGLTKDEMSWAAIAHASIIVTVLIGLATGGLGGVIGIAIPAIIWYAYRNKSAYVVDQARQATIFQVAGIVALVLLIIGGVILLVLGWVVTGLLSAILVGLILIPFMLILTLLFVVAVIGLPIAQLVYGCYAAVEVYNGRPFRYRWVADWIDRYLAHA